MILSHPCIFVEYYIIKFIKLFSFLSNLLFNAILIVPEKPVLYKLNLFEIISINEQ